MKFIFRASPARFCLHHVKRFSTSPLLGKPSVAPRQLWSNTWIPQARLKQQSEITASDVNDLLVRAGFVRQAYSGIFHMLPLGLRVQSKIEALVDKHMQSLNASKVSLSSLSSQSLWEKSGRYRKDGEFFSLKDRKGTNWILAPTHEEEITQLVKDMAHAPGDLPIRVYQISRKYRDEKRPRGGLLRGKEFLMKDLYTFDRTGTDAQATYDAVRKAYTNIFDELKVQYIEARADSGNMGGSLSHEFHFPSNLGEDDIISCSTCDYARNEEFVPEFKTTDRQFEGSSHPEQALLSSDVNIVAQSFICKDHNTLVKAFASSTAVNSEINPFVVKDAMKGRFEVDTGTLGAETRFKEKMLQDSSQSCVHYLFNHTFNDEVVDSIVREDLSKLEHLKGISKVFISQVIDEHNRNLLLKQKTGDSCPECAVAGRQGSLIVQKAIEIGHTFHLGARYSSKLELKVPGSADYVSMGCHGIGVSRLIAAAASALSDSIGLMWPRAIAPYDVCIVAKDSSVMDKCNEVYDDLTTQGVDVLIDDRNVGMGWKLKDADLIGFPVLLVLGRVWEKTGTVEIQCRRLQVKEQLPAGLAVSRVTQLLKQL